MHAGRMVAVNQEDQVSRYMLKKQDDPEARSTQKINNPLDALGKILFDILT